jgi:AraC-like DNA-binding protein
LLSNSVLSNSVPLERPPHPLLRPYVDRFWWRVASDSVSGGSLSSSPPSDSAAASDAARILPDGCSDVLVDLAHGGASVVGAMTRATLVPSISSLSIAAVRFRPGAAVDFLGVSADELTDARVRVEDLPAPWLRACCREHAGPGAAVAALERMLLERLAVAPPPDPARRRVAHAVRALLRAPSLPIQELAADLGWTRQHLGRVFRRRVGLGPKELARISRLQRAVYRLQRAPDMDLARVALELGYFDQAHMARDFRELAGVTPAAARAASGSIFPIPSLWLEA